MLRISKLTDYATLILAYLASSDNEVVSAKSMASTCRLSLPTVSKILKILAEAGLVLSTRGTGGGYQLARPSHDITMTDIVTAIEGKIAITACSASTCSLDAWCIVKENWKKVNKMILQTLAEVTLSDMIRPLPVIPERTQ